MDSQTLAEQIHRLRNTFHSGKTRDVNWRCAQLQAMHRMFAERSGEFETALHTDLRKSAFECFATETGFVDNEVKHALEHLGAWSRPRRTGTPVFLQPASSAVVFEPLGVALIIGAWNYPIQVTLGPLVAAIAAGNAAVIKPPRTAKATFAAIGRILPQYLDQDAFLVISDDTPNELILSQRWDKIFFTGSARTGKIVMQAAASHLTPVTLELGGKSPALVDKTANLPVAARRLVQGKFMNAGQTCVAPDYILAHEAIYDKLLAELTMAVGEFYGKEPARSGEYSRIINTKQFDALVTYLSDGEPVCGGQWSREDRYIAPTILKNVSPDAPVMQQEIFGPIFPVLPVSDMDAALQFVRQREKPLAFYIFSEDRAVIDNALSGSTSGGACVNDTLNHLVVPGLPFGGVGVSGMGKYHGEWGFRAFSNARAVLEHQTSFDPALRYPPFDSAKLTNLKKLMSVRLPGFLEGVVGGILARWGDQVMRLVR